MCLEMLTKELAFNLYTRKKASSLGGPSMSVSRALLAFVCAKQLIVTFIITFVCGTLGVPMVACCRNLPRTSHPPIPRDFPRPNFLAICRYLSRASRCPSIRWRGRYREIRCFGCRSQVDICVEGWSGKGVWAQCPLLGKGGLQARVTDTQRRQAALRAVAFCT